jgi:glycosyltransferase involved in cell wall biosynthesis
MLGTLKAAFRAAFGLFPLLEVRNKARHPARTLRLHSIEYREAQRLLEHIGGHVTATIVTIIPTYRRLDLVEAAVSSALAQEVGDGSHRVIVVDDGGGQLPRFDDDRVVAVSLSRNTGTAGVVRNVGMRISRSPFIALLDDDNRWLPGHLTSSLGELSERADLTYTGIRRRGPDGAVIDELSVPFDRRALRERAYVDTSAIVFRRRRGIRFSRVPRNRQTVPKEDWEFIHRVSRRRRIKHVPTITVEYLIHDDSYFSTWGNAASTGE